MHIKQNQELSERAKKNSGFAEKLAQNALKFRHFEQLALYSSSSEPSEPFIIPINHVEKHSKANLQIVIGFRQPTGPKAIEKILLQIVNVVPKPSESYSVLYVNTLAGNYAYGDFKKIMEFLPEEYFTHLERIYVLHANFKSKANYWISFDYLTNYIRSKTVYLDSFRDLAEKAPFNKEMLLKLLPSKVVDELARREETVRQILEVKKVKDNIVFNPQVYNLEQEAYVQKKPPLLAMVGPPKPAPNKSIEQYEVGRTGAPLIIELLISYFNGKEDLLDTEGLFRKSVSIEEETALLKELSQENYDCLENVTDPHLIANAIKRFLSNLAEPIIPYVHFDALMETPQDKFNEKILQIVSELKNNRKITILLLLDFLKTKLNKMTENNLSIVLGPCLMHSETPSMKDLIYTKKSINATSIIFIEFDKIFGNARERVALIRNSVRIQERLTLRERFEGLNEEKGENKEENSENILLDLLRNEPDKQQTEDFFIEPPQAMKQEKCFTKRPQRRAYFQQQEDQQDQQQLKKQTNDSNMQ